MEPTSRAARNLLFNLIRRDLTVRYKATALGFFWSFLKPLALTAVFWVVFEKVLNLRLHEQAIPFSVHLLTAMLAWNFFAGATNDALGVILGNANLIKKVRLPLAVFPLATVCAHMVHFLLALLVLFILLIFVGLPPGLMCLLAAPVLVLAFFATLAVSLALSALNVFYRDIASIWEVGLQAWFYATPIIYPVYLATYKMEELGLMWAKWLYMLNPLTPIVLALRRVLLYGSAEGDAVELPDGELLLSLGLCTVATAVLTVAAWVLFQRLSRSFNDVL